MEGLAPGHMETMTPIYTAGLFHPLHHELMAVLRGLHPDAWQAPTIAGRWRVRDVAAHLLDADLRKLSVTRDRHMVAPDRPIDGYRDLVAFLNDFNAIAVRAFERLSPRVLTDLLEVTGSWVADLVLKQPAHEHSVFPVDWAGESRSENWMDTGREYTERWHHQMQIRLAAGLRLLMDARWFHPLLEISVRALRRAYAGVDVAPGTAVTLHVSGDPRWTWSVVRDADGWDVHRGAAPAPTATVSLDPDTAWRVFYHAQTAADAASLARIEGNAALTVPLFAARAVMV